MHLIHYLSRQILSRHNLKEGETYGRYTVGNIRKMKVLFMHVARIKLKFSQLRLLASYSNIIFIEMLQNAVKQ